MEEWMSPTILLSTDFELIRSEIIKFNYCCSKTQKCASYYLSKKFNCPDRAQWSTEAKLLLVYCATLHQEDDTAVDIPSEFPFHTVTDWIIRLQKFNSITKKKQVTRDCVFQLFRLRELQWPDLLNHPMLLAALAHRISVHELMNHRIEGKSIVTQVLLKPIRGVRYCFLESLYGAYKDDFQHIISRDLSELLTMIELELKKCFTFLERTKLRFPAVDFAFAHLHPDVTKYTAWYEIEPVKQSGFNDLYKAVYEESQEALKRHIRCTRSKVIEYNLPYVNVLYALVGLDKPKNLNEFVGDGQSVFPFLELPLEIIELIILNLDLHSMQALRCVASGFKTLSANAKQLMKVQFPLKHHQLGASKPKNSASIAWETIYWRDSSLLTRWNRGKYSQFIFNGQVKAMDENIMIVDPNWYGLNEKRNYFWTRQDDDTRTQHHIEESSEQHSSWFAQRSVAIIDSNAADPLIAVAFQDQVELFVGPKCISKHRLIDRFFKYFHSCNYKLFIDQYMYTLDERFSSQKVVQDSSEILDVNPMNDMFMSITPYRPDDFRVKLHSSKCEVIGTLFDKIHYNGAKFLDEYQVVGVAPINFGIGIDIADIRKTSEVVQRVHSPTNLGESIFCIDAVNQRVLTVASRIATIWGINTRQWSGGFYVEGGGRYSHNYHGPLRANTRYFTFQDTSSNAIVYDFKN